jgi:hypothetical protein
MESLVIADNNNEYYLNGRKLYLLENIGRINLFIGANNTRKSRFLRKIIEAEARTIISSDDHINKAYVEGLSLVEEIEINFKNSLRSELMVVTITKHPPQPDKRFYDVDAYFSDSRAANDRGVNFKTIVDHLNSVNKTLLGIRVDDTITSFLKEIKQVYALLDMLVCLYEFKSTNPGGMYNYLTDHDIWPEENLRAYAFTFADGLVNDDTAEKEKTLKKVRHYFKSLLNVEVEIGSNRLIYIPVLRSALLRIERFEDKAGWFGIS